MANRWDPEFKLTEEQITLGLQLLAERLALLNIEGEITLLGGAVMCLVHFSRSVTQDTDAVFRPRGIILNIAREIALGMKWPSNWPNDAASFF
jgi:hypothetical protein